MTNKPNRPCGNPDCGVSSGMGEELTFGSGELNFNGYWSNPCRTCAEAWEKSHPEEDCWPYKESEDEDREAKEDYLSYWSKSLR